MLSLTREDGYEICSDPTRLDLDRIHHWLSTDAYWALKRPREVVVRAFTGSLPFGIYRPGDGQQVAVARAVTDATTFAWIGDVYVDRAERGRGLGTWLAATIRDELTSMGVRRVVLATEDAHGVYERVGFVALPNPQQWMTLPRRESA